MASALVYLSVSKLDVLRDWQCGGPYTTLLNNKHSPASLSGTQLELSKYVLN